MRIGANGMKTLALGAALTGFACSGAFGQDVDAALERIKALMAEQGVALDWAEAEISGADATLTGVTATADGEAQPIGDIAISGIADVANGYRVERISMPSYSATNSGGTLTLTDLVLDGVLLPDAGVEASGLDILFYERAVLGAARVEKDGRELFALGNLNVEVTPPEGDGELAFTGGAETFSTDLSVPDDPKSQEVLARLGYEQVSGSMAFAGSWAAADGRLKLSQYEFVVDEAGTLSVNFDISGYTSAVAKGLRDTTTQLIENPDADPTAGSIALFGLLQQVNLHRLEIEFTDGSLTSRVLEFAAQEQGTPVATVVDQTRDILPAVLARYNAPKIAEMVTTAVGAFLEDPKSLTILAAPPSPVSLAILMVAGAASPDALVEPLNLSITANE